MSVFSLCATVRLAVNDNCLRDSRCRGRMTWAWLRRLQPIRERPSTDKPLSVYLSSIYLSIYLSICLYVCLNIFYMSLSSFAVKFKTHLDHNHDKIDIRNVTEVSEYLIIYRTQKSR